MTTAQTIREFIWESIQGTPKASKGSIQASIQLFTIVFLFAAPPVLFAADDWEIGKPVALFDGKSLDGWTTADGKPAPSGWTVEDGCIVRASRGGNIFYHREVGDFELRFEWKIVKGGNNGIKYRVRRYQGQMLGCEYQVLGETSPGFSKGSTGALYALFEPSKDKKIHPPDQWNEARIVAHGPRLQHFMNGVKLVDVEVGSEAWQQRLSQSKFAPHHTFARNTKGRIMITDHGAKVWYRNMMLTPLEPLDIPPAPQPHAVSALSADMAQAYDIDASVYKKWARTHNVLIVASDQVSSAAVAETSHQLDQLLSAMRPNLAQRIRDQHVICVVKAADEPVSGLPWLREAQGVGGRPAWAGKVDDRIVMAVCQEDVLSYSGDKADESRLVRAYGDLVFECVLDARLKKRLSQLYQAAKSGKQWRDAAPLRRLVVPKSAEPTLLQVLVARFPDRPASFFQRLISDGAITVNGKPASDNQQVNADSSVAVHWEGNGNGGQNADCLALASEKDFWAEAVQSWFNANAEQDYRHNGVRTRSALKKYDPELGKLCEDVLRSLSWSFTPPQSRAGGANQWPAGIVASDGTPESWRDTWSRWAK